MKSPVVIVKNLSKSFCDGEADHTVFRNVSFQIEQGEKIALMGQSGVGKSTLLHVLGGFQSIDSGVINIDGQLISEMNDGQLSKFRRNKLGMVFQDYNLISSLNVHDNIAFSRRLKGMSEEDTLINQLVDVLGIEHRLKHFPNQLSGGELQRVSIARAIASEPKLLLADEPTGNLDEETAETVMSLLVSLVNSYDITLLLVTHSQSAANYLDEIWRFDRGKLLCQSESH